MAGTRTEQSLVSHPPEVVEAAEVADVGGAASRGGRGIPAHDGVVLRVSADVNQSPTRDMRSNSNIGPRNHLSS